MTYYLVSSEEEKETLSKFNIPDGKIYVIGDSMLKTTYEDTIVNIGYVNGYRIADGEIIEPSFAIDAFTGRLLKVDRIFKVRNCLCLSVENLDVSKYCDEASIIDTELYGIGNMPYKKLHALKIVNNNGLFNKDVAWIQVTGLLNKYL